MLITNFFFEKDDSSYHDGPPYFGPFAFRLGYGNYVVIGQPGEENYLTIQAYK